MTYNNLILIKGGIYDDIKKALQQWIDAYSDQLKSDDSFQIYRVDDDQFVIQADERLGNDLFFYLVNYLKYPEDIDYSVDVTGYTTGRKKGPFRSKEIMVYLSPSDTEYDNVLVVTADGEPYKVEFGGKITSVEKSKMYSLPRNLKLNKPEVLKVPESAGKEKDSMDERQVRGRTTLITIITISFYLINFILYIFLNDHYLFHRLNSYLGFGVFCWFFFDYEMLRIPKLYQLGLILAILIRIYGYAMEKIFESNVDDFIYLSSSSPFFILILQWPLRKIFVTFFERKPKTERNGNLPDVLYTMILMITTFVLPTLLLKFLH